ncbi:hypothetical protein G6011_05838 [Alternaria panax]|uniref:Saponin hydrolase n=1 Tax=Alternaria panax TaxID=48097 RepID=A0AAD4I4X4_9PLEO|nr:hypothetical protein G6011_05838 [Alternaria panax]
MSLLHLLAGAVALGVIPPVSYQSSPDQQAVLTASPNIPEPPRPEEISVIELPLPPVSASKHVGACTAALNPKRTGCIAQELTDQFQAGDFTPDGQNVIVTVTFVGAPAAPDPANIYNGVQLILIKADGTNFSNGDPWKCLTCGVPTENARELDPQRDYPHVFRSGDKAIWGHNILDCNGKQLASDACTPNDIHIYPIYWPSGAPRELRMHPDDRHLGWSSFTNNAGQYSYFGRLEFNAHPSGTGPPVPRYDLVDVDLLVDPKRRAFITADGDELKLQPDSITIGELRGFSGSGDEILYIGAPTESTNIDLYAVHIETGVVRRLTSHPDYADPIAFSADDQWFVTQDTRASERQMWMSGMRGIPPLVDIVAVAVAASTRNNGVRRFFQPILIDRYGDRGSYYGQQINGKGDKSEGDIDDPNWNGRADPAFSLDSTRIVYWQSIVTSPACGGINPLSCPISTARGGREYRVMLAHLGKRKPTLPAPVYKAPTSIPWATPFPPGSSIPPLPTLKPGNYILRGKVSGCAEVTLIGDAAHPEASSVKRVIANYTDFSDDGDHIINGSEDVELTVLFPNLWNQRLDWYSDIVQTGSSTGSKKTSAGGLHLRIDVMKNILESNGTLTTSIDGVGYYQPANGT